MLNGFGLAKLLEIRPLKSIGPRKDRVEVAGLRPPPLPHHRTCGFPHPAIEPCGVLNREV